MIQKTFLREKNIALLFFLAFFSCTQEAAQENELTVILQDSLLKKEVYPELKAVTIGAFEQNLIDQYLVNIQELDSSLMVDLKYSSTDNFFGKDVYHDLTKAYLPYNVAERLKIASELLQADYPNFRLLVYDAVRPHSVQQTLWNALDSIPEEVRKAYVADPAVGSLHNYGCAVDLTIFDTAADSVLDMGTAYDHFGYLAYPRKEQELLVAGKLSIKQIGSRLVLRDIMRKAGFTPIKSEWWHFNRTSLARAKRDYDLIK